MRFILAVAATALAASAIASTAAYAQTSNNPGAYAQAPTNPAAARASLNQSYNKCVSLAKSRGYTESDLDGNRAAARNFVIRCMQGKQR